MDNEIYRIILVLVLSGLFFFAWQYYRGAFNGQQARPIEAVQQVKEKEIQEDTIRKDLSEYKNCGILRILVFPIYKSLEIINKATKNPGIALGILTLLFRTMLAPLMIKQFNASKKMASLQDKIQRIKKRYEKNPIEMQKAIGRLFKENGVNPFKGIGIGIIQIPLFIAMYKIVREADIFTGAPLGLWIKDLGAADPYYILPAVSGVLMYLSTRFSGQTGTQMPGGLVYIFPIMCTVFLLNQPAGLALYFIAGNIFQLALNIFISGHVRQKTAGL